MDLFNLENAAAQYVTSLFNKFARRYLTYHTLKKTEKVVGYVAEIAGHYNLAMDEKLNLALAAWFHDTGHLFTTITGHEEESVNTMRRFFIDNNVPHTFYEPAAACIMATKFPPSPQGLVQEILCDADTYHFGTNEFRTTDVQVKKEMELRTGKYFLNWNSDTLKLLNGHHFFTDYCARKLAAGKQVNIDYLHSLITGEN